MDPKLLVVIILANVIVKIEAYSSGAPFQKCDNMQPSPTAHGSPQTSNSPYMLTVREQIIKSGDTVKLDIEKIDATTPDFKGFIVQGRDAQNDSRLGSFIVKDDDPNMRKQDGCEKGSVTHKNGNLKNNVTVLWKSPVGIQEAKTVEFKFTVVQSHNTFWVRTIGSNNVVVKVNEEYVPNPEPDGETEPEPESSSEPEPESEGSKHAAFEGCNDEKGCFGVPGDCVSKGSCKMMTSYAFGSGNLKMQIYAKGLGSGQYAAMGFSNDDKMGNDVVFSCSNGGSTINTHWNNGRSNGNLDGIEVENIKVETKDGATVCDFTIPDKFSANGNDFDVSATKFYILMAMGQASGRTLSYHGPGNRYPSGSSVDFTKIEAIKGAGPSYLIQIHGMMMVIAWIFSATIGMIFARYYKETWRQIKPRGKDLWFRLHQFLMGLTVVLTFAAFWVMVAEAGFFRYSPEFIKENPHPPIGATCLILALIQPLMAFFRPHPGTGKRWVFDWAHWLCGNAAFFLGVVAIFFAAELESADLPKAVTGVMLAFVVVHVLVHLCLTVQRKLASSNGVKDSSTGNDHALLDLSGSAIRKMLVAFYVAFVFSMTIALCFLIFKNKIHHGSDGDPEAEPEAEAEAEAEG